MQDKPKLEELIPKYLDGDMQKSALDFILYMRANKMAPAYRPSLRFKCNYKGKGICTVSLPRKPDYGTPGIDNEFAQAWMSKENVEKNNWIVIPHLDYFNEYEKLIDDGMKNIIWDKKNMYFCNGCWTSNPNYPKPRDCCGPRPKRTIFGKEFEGLCGRAFFWFFNPDETAIDCIKKLLILEQKARTDES